MSGSDGGREPGLGVWDRVLGLTLRTLAPLPALRQTLLPAQK